MSDVLSAPALHLSGTVTTPYGTFAVPTWEAWKAYDRIVREQEALFTSWCQCGESEEQQGRAAMLERKVVRLEMQKHPLLREATAQYRPKRPLGV